MWPFGPLTVVCGFLGGVSGFLYISTVVEQILKYRTFIKYKNLPKIVTRSPGAEREQPRKVMLLS